MMTLICTVLFILGIIAACLLARWRILTRLSELPSKKIRAGRTSENPAPASPLSVPIPEIITALLLAFLLSALIYAAIFLCAKWESARFVRKELNLVKMVLAELGHDPDSEEAWSQLKNGAEHAHSSASNSVGVRGLAEDPKFYGRWRARFVRAKPADQWSSKAELSPAFQAAIEACGKQAEHSFARGLESIAGQFGKDFMEASPGVDEIEKYFMLQPDVWKPLPRDAHEILRRLNLKIERWLGSDALALDRYQFLLAYLTRGVEQTRLHYRPFTAVWGLIQFLTIVVFLMAVMLWVSRYARIPTGIGFVEAKLERFFPTLSKASARPVLVLDPFGDGETSEPIMLEDFEEKQKEWLDEELRKLEGRIFFGKGSSLNWWRSLSGEICSAISTAQSQAGAKLPQLAAAAKGAMSEAMDQLAKRLEQVEYRLFGWLAGVIPALGFIGTVYGIAAALDKSGALAQAGDTAGRAAALNAVTTELGVAFDTTLVALICGIVLGGVAWLVERKELGTLHDIRDGYFRHLQGLTVEEEDRAPEGAAERDVPPLAK